MSTNFIEGSMAIQMHFFHRIFQIDKIYLILLDIDYIIY